MFDMQNDFQTVEEMMEVLYMEEIMLIIYLIVEK